MRFIVSLLAFGLMLSPLQAQETPQQRHVTVSKVKAKRNKVKGRKPKTKVKRATRTRTN